MPVVLSRDISSCRVPSLRRPLNVRGALPNVYAGGFENCDVSNQRSGRGSSSFALRPVQFGRWPPAWANVLFTADVIPSGPPLKNETMPEISQPPSSLPENPLCSRRNGISYTVATVRRCVWSSVDGLHSAARLFQFWNAALPPPRSSPANGPVP